MSYLRSLCLFAYSGVQHILCCVVFFNLSSSCVPNVASFYGLSFYIAPSVFYNVYICIYVCVFYNVYICIYVCVFMCVYNVCVFYNVYICIYVCVFIYYCYCCSTGIWYQKSYILVSGQS